MSKAEKFISDYTRNCSNIIETINRDKNVAVVYQPWLTPENALKAVEIAKEEVIENLWKDAQSNNLPEIDREVIALIQDRDDAGIYKVVFAHRPNPKGWDGRSLTTGEVEHYEPKTYDRGGWNMPNVKYWLDVEIPNE